MHLFNLFAILFACVPLAELWSHVPGGHCFNTRTFFTVGSALFTLSDAIVLLLPILPIWRMRTMSRTRKLQITGIFLLGWFVVAIAIVKTYVIVSCSFPVPHRPY